MRSISTSPRSRLETSDFCAYTWTAWTSSSRGTRPSASLTGASIDFADAVEVFYDDLACITIRIISARLATAAERRHYEQG